MIDHRCMQDDSETCCICGDYCDENDMPVKVELTAPHDDVVHSFFIPDSDAPGLINANACRSCPNGVSGDSKYFAGAEELHFEIENNQVQGDPTSSFARDGLPNRLAAPCGRACVAHYEAAQDKGYKIPFRIREPWGFRPDEERRW